MRAAAIAIVVLAGVECAAAQNVENALDAISGTLRTYHEPLMSNGRLDGCQLSFEALQRDWTYRQGGFIRVSGHAGVLGMGNPRRFGATLKVVVNEVNIKTLSTAPNPPTRAYIIGPDFKSNLKSLVSASKSDTPGGLFSIFHLEPTIDFLIDAVVNHKLTVAFNKAGGNSDIQMVIETDVVSTDNAGARQRSSSAESEFLACLKAMTSE